ncbi:MAG TPA: acetate--CoA ligase family protein [Kofleriaceae bacterium]|nr:acetate--CoA ligase family protein [Kofleriaceae bacterium]
MADPSTLEDFFSPQSVAVVGASSRPESVGFAVLRNLLFGGDASNAGDLSATLRGFRGRIFPINPKGGEVLGRKVYASLAECGQDIDLVVVAIPPAYITALMDEVAAVNCRACIVITAGFAEMGEDGKALQDQMVAAARRHGIRVIGPNCLGVIRPPGALNASFAAAAPPPGKIGLLSQSGALITGIISYAEREQFGLSAAVSLGAKADVDDGDIIRWLGTDSETTAIGVYVEGFPSPREVFEVMRAVAPLKPIVALKGGATAAGAKAASSHTGSLAGSQAAYSAAFAQAGVLQSHSVIDFLAWLRALAYQPVAAGKRLAIVTNAGGPGVLSADEAARHGVELAELSPQTLEELDGVLPAVWSRGNPVDIIGDATPARYRDALNIIGRAPEVDGIVVIMTVQAMTAPEDTARAIIDAHQDPSWKKPLISSFLGLMGTEVGALLDRHGIPEFNTPETAISSMGALMKRGAWLGRESATYRGFPRMPAPELDKARRLVKEAQAAGQTNLDLARAREVLAAAGLRYNGSGTARNDDEAVTLASEIGFPVVIKVVSPDVLHKSDVGGVVLNVIDAEGVREACTTIRGAIAERQPGARIDGFTIEEMVTGTEIIVGMSRDPGFGPLMMVGIGGIFVEVYKDVAFRLIPLSRTDALEVIDEIKAQPLLDGARKRPVLDRAELAEVLLRVSRLVEEVPEIAELDLNPLVITTGGLVAIDARVIAAKLNVEG